MEHKNQFIEILLKNYDKFTWTRDNFEFSTEFGDYIIALDTAKTGVVLSVVYTPEDGEIRTYHVYADINENVQTIYDGVFNLWNIQREEKFWEDATLELSKEIIANPFFKVDE